MGIYAYSVRKNRFGHVQTGAIKSTIGVEDSFRFNAPRLYLVCFGAPVAIHRFFQLGSSIGI